MTMREYEIWRIVDVNMYNSLLSPDVTLDEDVQDDAQEAAREALWNRFDSRKYSDFVRERAVIELKKLLKRLPSGMRVRYVEGSAEIYSPPYYNYGGDELIFRIKARVIAPRRACSGISANSSGRNGTRSLGRITPSTSISGRTRDWRTFCWTGRRCREREPDMEG